MAYSSAPIWSTVPSVVYNGILFLLLSCRYTTYRSFIFIPLIVTFNTEEGSDQRGMALLFNAEQ